jgi:hypothetical protein
VTRLAATWYEVKEEGLGERCFAEIKLSYARIERHPEGYAVSHTGLRKALCHRFPYAIYFAFDSSDWVVFGVLHQLMEPTALDDRLP